MADGCISPVPTVSSPSVMFSNKELSTLIWDVGSNIFVNHEDTFLLEFCEGLVHSFLAKYSLITNFR